MKGDVFQSRLPGSHARFCFAQIILPKEFRIGKTRGQHLLVALQYRSALIGRLNICHSHKALNTARFRICDREEFLMFFHRGLQYLWRQIQKFLINLAHEDNGPLDEPCHLRQ